MSSQRISIELFEVQPLPSGFGHRARMALKRWRDRANQRRALAQFDEIMLRDLGITPADVWREANQPPWR